MMSYTVSRQREHFDLRKMLAVTRELQLDGIDFVTLHEQKAEDLRRLADDHGVPVVCHTFSGAELNHPTPEARHSAREECRRGFAAAAVLGAPCVMVVTPGREGLTREQSRANYSAGLSEIAPLAKAAGVVLTLENFPGENSPFVTSGDFLSAAAVVPGLCLTYDNGNCATGEEPAGSFAAVAGMAVHAHFKDWEIRREPAAGFRRMLDGRYYRPALIGEGDLDHRACLRAMKQAGYSGCINIEYENDRYDPYEATRRAADYLRGLAAELGY